ncbi:uncharacterized protein TNCT_498191 [Trichonephila clavata]|uniref:Mutator-like transposase domain-containing protein n=1 Tax=Trichonephila clavata TaxID=2740835 RepID=A0A8X6F467_TRICU|nr:uncharacterized protein TNCT_498191 [Trichonephila clavata]
MKVMSEVRKGLNSGISMKCEMCNFQEIIWTEDPHNEKMPVNTAVVSGIMKIGGGFANLEEFLSTLDIPPLSSKTYQKEHNTIATAWEKVAEREMYSAAMEEKQLAVQAGEIGPDGFPTLTVVVDGCWAKRSYRNNYSSLSGVAAIVGFRTKKVIYMGVRNRYCMVCSRAAAANEQVGRHCCSKNWHGSSSSMEANIIQEGFMNIVAMYGIKYTKIIGDGDSNVYKTILDSRPYDALQVEKLEYEEIKDIERKTINQRTSPLWKEERRKRLTASDFGAICKKLPHTSCEGIIKKKLYSHFRSSAMEYGESHEGGGVEKLRKRFGFENSSLRTFHTSKTAVLSSHS